MIFLYIFFSIFYERDNSNSKYDLRNVDVNKMTREEGMKVKEEMDVMFKKNQINPGDPGYEYDVREDFESNPKEPSDWD